jgi:hypothetical protein
MYSVMSFCIYVCSDQSRGTVCNFYLLIVVCKEYFVCAEWSIFWSPLCCKILGVAVCSEDVVLIGFASLVVQNLIVCEHWYVLCSCLCVEFHFELPTLVPWCVAIILVELISSFCPACLVWSIVLLLTIVWREILSWAIIQSQLFVGVWLRS